jgi:hypothetical protein
MRVKDKALPGGKLPGFAAEGFILTECFSLNQSLTKKLWKCKKKLNPKTQIDGKGGVYEREGT